MIGRGALQNPLWLSELHPTHNPSIRDVASAYLDYLQQYDHLTQPMIAPLLALMHGKPNARHCRRHISTSLRDQILLRQRLSELPTLLEDFV